MDSHIICISKALSNFSSRNSPTLDNIFSSMNICFDWLAAINNDMKWNEWPSRVINKIFKIKDKCVKWKNAGLLHHKFSACGLH